ncbi:MAG: dTDP-4-dehydrorhamnose reductase [Fibrobacteres bacterium]|nr:dTDP-4-dehydrorhamnose reductase [Fibrobacterota bacterium]
MTEPEKQAGRPGVEVWGGLECTINRVRERYFDQFEMTGHVRRPNDLELVAALGIKTVRYPVLWEKVSPVAPDREDWSFADDRLALMRHLAMRPIVGLIHHGSGPAWTGMMDPGFPDQLARHAAKVARRYPWIEAYTPVNEPLTTARFCGLYGHWHPHGRSDREFVRALLAQCRAIILCMRAIREVNPNAILVQTEDLGKTQSTPPLAYQAAFDNDRRWLSCDLLRGEVDRNHPLWGYLLGSGAREAELAEFQEAPCPPDILGFNYYLTSERYLDHNLDRYPAGFHGGNGRHAYADIEAVRSSETGISGPGGLLREAWERYRSPLAMTETHLGCTREDQVRWVREVWDAVNGLRDEGIPMRAMTFWSLFGACEWNSLVTREEGHYEPGAFDIRAPKPRPTALAALASQLAAGRTPEDPLSAAPGWWRRPERFLHSSTETPSRSPQKSDFRRSGQRPVLITGANGTLARALSRICQGRGIRHARLSRSQMDIADKASVERALIALRPWAVINAAGYVRVDQAETEPERCLRENAIGPAVLAEACARLKVRMLTFSSDLVFDGSSVRPYLESDPVSPLNIYGRSKAIAEEALRTVLPEALVIRTSAFFGPWDGHNFLAHCLASLAKGESVKAADNLTVSPTYVPDLANACLDLFLDGEKGVWHLANPGAVTWADLARRTAEYVGSPVSSIEAMPYQVLFPGAPRPLYSVLGSERGWILPPLERSLDRCLDELTSAMAMAGNIQALVD